MSTDCTVLFLQAEIDAFVRQSAIGSVDHIGSTASSVFATLSTFGTATYESDSAYLPDGPHTPFLWGSWLFCAKTRAAGDLWFVSPEA
jgi:hypothetical protein